ncbi:hypothetical protein GQ43DRAFT_425930 [Delitschia confertaspora ATCC 74209]|uniref:Uncharacterized protein n=1 Tax=Delitschia confertaspora ATCC 74209 TaxID=1513339 RepID=A0A9P4JEE2_9PLEO|nr:hypothetical protein GQ43DRAFT_425930 [Delitschia confertaspora ATCC 74209]
MDDSRYQLVDTIYGPGTVISWLLTICSAFISWTFNARHKRKDTITYDFIAALAYPTIAASHIVHQLLRLPAPFAEIVASRNDPNLLMIVVAIEAPLNICETFTAVAFLAFLVNVLLSSSNLSSTTSDTRKLKRTGLIHVVGMLCWAVESVMFAKTRNISYADRALERPYMYTRTPFMVTNWISLAINFVVWILLCAYRPTKTDPDLEVRGARVQDRMSQEKYFGQEEHAGHTRCTRQNCTKGGKGQCPRHSFSECSLSNILLYSALSYLPVAFMITVLNGVGAFGELHFSSKRSLLAKGFFFIPKSMASLSDLDQVVALIGGVITVAFSCWEAYKSTKIGDGFWKEKNHDTILLKQLEFSRRDGIATD